MVLVVGYDTDPIGWPLRFSPSRPQLIAAGPYWIVKNSWGLGYGENGTGYWRIARNSNDMCFIASQAVYPWVARTR
jgi:hypothetical protein